MTGLFISWYPQRAEDPAACGKRGIHMSELRVRKIQEFIKQEVSQMLLYDLKDPHIGFVTVTGVHVTGDLREATIYVSLFGKSWEKAKSLEALNKAKGFIRKELGQRLKIYYTLEITFEEDKSLDYGMHIEGLLKKVHDEEKDKAPKEDTEKED